MWPHRPYRRAASRRMAMLAAAVLLTTGACEFTVGSDDLNIPALEAEITRGIEDQTGIQVQSVDCPDTVPIEEGNTFTCTVTADDGTTGEVEVVQEDDEGNVTWELVTS